MLKDFRMSIVLAIFLLLFFPGLGHAEAEGLSPVFHSEEELDLFCLRQSYPQILGMERMDDGSLQLHMADGGKVPYALADGQGQGYAGDVRSSMQWPYPLEPERPDLPAGFSPGRKRSYGLLAALHGQNEREVRSRLIAVPFLGKKIPMSGLAADALEKVGKELEALRQDEGMKPLLTPDGGFYWRRIAGETRLSPHSYGIAIDLGVQVATYWRWSNIRPHPMQKSYPGVIVQAFEQHGFIWGGKWHEYDLMHFEYRPELLCKARAIRAGMFGPACPRP